MTAIDPDPPSGDMAGEIDSAELHSAEVVAAPDENADSALNQVQAAGQELENASEDITETGLESVAAALDVIESAAPTETVADDAETDPSPIDQRPAVTNVKDLDKELATNLETALENDSDPFGTAEEIETAAQPAAPSEPETASAEVDVPQENTSVAPSPSPEEESTHDSPVDTTGIRTRAEAIAHVLLSRLNAPLKLIPESKRNYVDWIALSLALWVPLIWLIVFFTRG